MPVYCLHAYLPLCKSHRQPRTSPIIDRFDKQKAYRKLALKHHPDRVSDPAQKEKETAIFAKIANAYEVSALCSCDPHKIRYIQQLTDTSTILLSFDPGLDG